jgi:hypothetical protein
MASNPLDFLNGVRAGPPTRSSASPGPGQASVDVGIVALILMIVGAAMIFRTLLFAFSVRQRPRSMPPPRY